MSSELKLFCCQVETTLYVLADDAADAEDLAIRHLHDETGHDISVEEISTDHAIWANWYNGVPYGGDHARTVAQLIAAMKVDRVEQQRLAELEALRVKMPFADPT